MSGFDDELKPDAEANRIISDPDLINIDIKELNKMLKERGISKVENGDFRRCNFDPRNVVTTLGIRS